MSTENAEGAVSTYASPASEISSVQSPRWFVYVKKSSNIATALFSIALSYSPARARASMHLHPPTVFDIGDHTRRSDDVPERAETGRARLAADAGVRL